jgi:hypothetical protein
VEGHDLAGSKLVAFREKDREFVRVLLAEQMIDSVTLLERIASLPISSAQPITSSRIEPSPPGQTWVPLRGNQALRHPTD